MSLRVIVIGTGGVGAHALRAVLGNSGYDLTGVWVSSAEKAGKDAGELAGIGRATGIVATTKHVISRHALRIEMIVLLVVTVSTVAGSSDRSSSAPRERSARET